MNLIYLSLGSNLGDKIGQLQKASAALEQFGKIIQRSSYYRSEALGFESENFFINQCLLWQTEFDAFEALTCINKIEIIQGRSPKKEAFYQDRIIDIDILYVNAEIIKTPKLEIPHSQLYKRRFVLLPLAEIAPDWFDPVYQMPVKKLLKQCQDTNKAVKFFL